MFEFLCCFLSCPECDAKMLYFYVCIEYCYSSQNFIDCRISSRHIKYFCAISYFSNYSISIQYAPKLTEFLYIFCFCPFATISICLSVCIMILTSSNSYKNSLFGSSLIQLTRSVAIKGSIFLNSKENISNTSIILQYWFTRVSFFAGFSEVQLYTHWGYRYTCLLYTSRCV